MKVLIILSALLAVSWAQYPFYGNLNYGAYSTPYAAHYATPYAAPYSYAAPVPNVHATQYHAQDELGQASFGHSEPGQAHAAVRDFTGAVRGSYAYIDPTGKEVRTNYIADELGFRVESNALPVAPIANLQAPVMTLRGPAPVQDTPEVMAARAEHLAAHAEAKSRQRRQVVYSGLSGLHGYSLGYSRLGYTGLTYAAPIAAAPIAAIPSTLTKTILNPGHAVAYRIE